MICGGHSTISSLGQLGLPLRAVQSTGEPAACQEVCYQNNCPRLFQARREITHWGWRNKGK